MVCFEAWKRGFYARKFARLSNDNPYPETDIFNFLSWQIGFTDGGNQ